MAMMVVVVHARRGPFGPLWLHVTGIVLARAAPNSKISKTEKGIFYNFNAFGLAPSKMISSE